MKSWLLISSLSLITFTAFASNPAGKHVFRIQSQEKVLVISQKDTDTSETEVIVRNASSADKSPSLIEYTAPHSRILLDRTGSVSGIISSTPYRLQIEMKTSHTCFVQSHVPAFYFPHKTELSCEYIYPLSRPGFSGSN